MSITSKSGDHGETGILFGHRIRKDDLRIHATGALDELDASLGLARALLASGERFKTDDPDSSQATSAALSAIHDVQKDLVPLMGQINTLPKDWPRYRSAGYALLEKDRIDRLEKAIATLEDELPPHDHWAVPGAAGHPAPAALEVARTVCRRAERHVFSLLPQIAGAPEDFHGLVYLNRLSDYLWLLARRWELPD